MDAQIANLILERDEARAVAQQLLAEREALVARVIEHEMTIADLHAELLAERWPSADTGLAPAPEQFQP